MHKNHLLSTIVIIIMRRMHRTDMSSMFVCHFFVVASIECEIYVWLLLFKVVQWKCDDEQVLIKESRAQNERERKRFCMHGYEINSFAFKETPMQCYTRIHRTLFKTMRQNFNVILEANKYLVCVCTAHSPAMM